MIEESKSSTIIIHSPIGTLEHEEMCSVCEKKLEVGTHVLRDKKTHKIICRGCISEVKRIA